MKMISLYVVEALLLVTLSSFQSQNIYFESETSFLHWKLKLRNLWGQ